MGLKKSLNTALRQANVGKNLVNVISFLSASLGLPGNTVTFNSNGYTITTTAPWGGANPWRNPMQLKPNTQYTFSWEGDDIPGAETMVYGAHQGFGTYGSRKYRKYTTDSQGRLGMYLTYQNVGTYQVNDIMLEEGATATDYEPYRGILNLSANSPLR